MVQLVKFQKLVTDLEMDAIEVAPENVRKTQLDTGLEGLKASIERLGLIHPIIVIPKGDRYRLIVGQRRYLAFRQLGRKTIPALVVKPVDSESLRLVSFGENIQRRSLPYDDTIEVCDYLFNKYTGSKTAKVEQVAKDLNISPPTVLKYLSYKLVPEPVRKLVREGKLPAQAAYRITVAFWPSDKKIEEAAKISTRLTKAERDRVIDLGKRLPEAPVEKIVDEAKKSSPQIEVVFYIQPQTMELLEKEAVRRKTDVQALVKSLVEDWVTEEGLS